MLLTILFAGVVIVFLPARAWRRYRKGTPPTPPWRYVTETLLLIAALSFLLWRNNVTLEALHLEWRPAARWFGDVAFCVLAIVGVDFLMVARTTWQLRTGAIVPAPKGLAADALAAQKSGVPFVFVTFVGAIWEELCFRGTVFALLPYTPTGVLLGVIGGAVLFGAQHLRHGLHGMIYSTTFGVIFASLFVITGNLWAVILAHAAGNLLAAWQWAPRIARARQQAVPGAPGFLG
jgi:membrane protease YdiL (CAAX protease family)